MSTAHAVEPEFYFCPFCGFRDPLLYAIHFHIESFHTPDSPFVVAEEKAKDIEITEEEHSYVLCPEEACQEPVLRQELQTHLDMHLAERVALTESVDETLSANSQAAIAIGSSCTNPPKGSSDVVASSSGSSKSKSKSSSKSSHLHLHRSSSLKSDRKYHSKGADDNRFLVLARSKKTKKLGSPELGPYAMEKQMPPELYYELLRGPSISYRIEIGPGNKLIRVATVANETPNLVPILARLSERDHLVARAWLCDPGVRHVGKQLPREGGFCGYRNIQMMISYIQATFPEGTHPFPGMVPSIIKLQDYIEKGWDMGINVHGRVETGGIKNTRKYIGTSEAETVFVSMGIPCGVKHLSRTPDREACEILFDFVQWFYERGRPAGNTDRILRTHKPPIYFQHAGHSMTIVGTETFIDGSRSLLVFDPSFSPSPGIQALIGTKRINPKINIHPLMRLHRRATPYLAKYREYELLTVQPNSKQTGQIDGFHMKPALKNSLGFIRRLHSTVTPDLGNELASGTSSRVY